MTRRSLRARKITRSRGDPRSSSLAIFIHPSVRLAVSLIHMYRGRVCSVPRQRATISIRVCEFSRFYAETERERERVSRKSLDLESRRAPRSRVSRKRTSGDPHNEIRRKRPECSSAMYLSYHDRPTVSKKANVLGEYPSIFARRDPQGNKSESIRFFAGLLLSPLVRRTDKRTDKLRDRGLAEAAPALRGTS